MDECFELYIDGRWVKPAHGETIDVVNPATEEVTGRIPAAGREDVDHAVMAARTAFTAWASTPVPDRVNFLKKIHQGLIARNEELAMTITAEMGMPINLVRHIQVGLPVSVMGSYATILEQYNFTEKIGNSLVTMEPVGVVACITPWNYPLHQLVAKVAPALAAGCTVAVKPSEVAPLSAFILAEIIHDSGLPPGVFNLVSGYGATVGEALAGHPEVDMVSFTGSTGAGRRVGVLAAATFKRVALELGGKSAAIILDDADLATAVKGTVGACFLNSGQTCSAHTRMLVSETLYETASRLAVEAAAAFTPGDPLVKGTRIGPLASSLQRERVRNFIRQGSAEGGKLLLGGPESPPGLERGYFVRPTIFGRVSPEMTIAREEIFGPVLVIMPYKDEDDAVRIANSTNYGLAGAVWSADIPRAERVAKRLRTGQIDINGAPFNPLAPFGGFKHSGHGRELGISGLEEFLESKSVQYPLQ